MVPEFIPVLLVLVIAGIIIFLPNRKSINEEVPAKVLACKLTQMEGENTYDLFPAFDVDLEVYRPTEEPYRVQFSQMLYPGQYAPKVGEMVTVRLCKKLPNQVVIINLKNINRTS